MALTNLNVFIADHRATGVRGLNEFTADDIGAYLGTANATTGSAATSAATAISTADSKGVSGSITNSTATSKAASGSVATSSADSAGVSAGYASSIAASKADSTGTSKTVSAGGGGGPTPFTANLGTSLSAPTGWAGYPGTHAVANFSDADFSGGKCFNFPFPVGTAGGSVDNNYYTHTFPGEIWMTAEFKISSPWQNHPSNSQKMFWFFCNSAGDMLIGWSVRTIGGAQQVGLHWTNEFGFSPDNAARWLPNIQDDAVTLGVKHSLKIHWKFGTGSGTQDSLVEWWLDGTKQASYTSMQFPALASAPFIDFNNQPYWGGFGSSKTENDYVRTSNIKMYTSDPG